MVWKEADEGPGIEKRGTKVMGPYQFIEMGGGVKFST